jgi:hypothetical protein
MYFPVRHPALMKSGSFARDSVTHGDDYIFSTRGHAESPLVGTPPAAPSPYDIGLREGELFFEVFSLLDLGVPSVGTRLEGLFAFEFSLCF